MRNRSGQDMKKKYRAEKKDNTTAQKKQKKAAFAAVQISA